MGAARSRANSGAAGTEALLNACLQNPQYPKAPLNYCSIRYAQANKKALYHFNNTGPKILINAITLYLLVQR